MPAHRHGVRREWRPPPISLKTNIAESLLQRERHLEVCVVDVYGRTALAQPRRHPPRHKVYEYDAEKWSN